MAMVDVDVDDSSLQAESEAHSPSWLAWSEDRQPLDLSVQSATISSLPAQIPEFVS